MARKMKDSGIEWIGEIPEGWEVAPLKRFASIQTGNTPTKTSDSNYYASTGIPWIKPDNLGYSHSISKTSEYLTSEGALCARIMPPNTVYVCCIGSLGKVGYSSISCACNQQINALIFNDLMFWKYGYYLTIAQESQYLLFGNGNVLQIINSTSQGNIACVLPPLENQHLIACYLDSVCSDIEVLISKTRSSIEEYKKLKQAVITQAVTKGVRGEREMKNSGVEWVSYIPVDWNTIKLKYCTYIRARLGWRALKADEYVESGFPFLSAFNIVNNALHFTNLNYINQFRYDESPEIRLKVGDVLLVKDGAGIGKCAIVENMPIPSTVNGSIAVISSTSFITPKYLYYYFLSEMFQQHIDLLKDGMGVPHLFQSDLKEIKIAFPSKDEQKEIADCLDAKCAEIDGLIAKKEQLAKELESYRKSLIYEVVTGKREV